MIRGILVGHSDICAALLKALESIAGSYDHIVPISNEGLSTPEITEIIRDAAREAGNEGMVIFVDVFGGSCWRAAKTAQISNAGIVTGVNLPMLLSFVNKRMTLDLAELVTAMEQDGKRGIRSE